MELNKIYNEDCLIGMQNIPDKSIDAIICDLPYGSTACSWDNVIPFDKLWAQYKRIIKDNGAIVLFGSQPFTSALVMSNVKWFKYCWVWEKDKAANFFNANRQVLKIHEDICVFYNKQCIYNPQMELLDKSYIHKNKSVMSDNFGKNAKDYDTNGYTEYTHSFPKSIIRFPKENGGKGSKHSTQKPVALIEYLIKTYTNEGETVLDNCMGSGTTAIACINTSRNFIGFELDKGYFEIAKKRIAEHTKDLTIF